MSDDKFFQTIPGQDFTTVHERVWRHPGTVVDVGCSGWDWCRAFLGKKRVVGLDPDLSVPAHPQAELIQTQLGPYNGTVAFASATAFTPDPHTHQSPIWSWKRFRHAAITKSGIAILKLNIEGGEWPLLACMDDNDFAEIDQIAVSFHDFVWPAMAKTTAATIKHLESHGFTAKQIYAPYNWWLFY